MFGLLLNEKLILFIILFDSSKFSEHTLEISFVMWLIPIGKVIEWTIAKFLNNHFYQKVFDYF